MRACPKATLKGLNRRDVTLIEERTHSLRFFIASKSQAHYAQSGPARPRLVEIDHMSWMAFANGKSSGALATRIESIRPGSNDSTAFSIVLRSPREPVGW